jgi:hypothetical protein
MNIDSRINAIARWGELLENIGHERHFESLKEAGFDAKAFEHAVENAMASNAWFTPDSVFNMLHAIGKSLNIDELKTWTGMYDLGKSPGQKIIAVIMAGNVPAVGFHDFLSVLICGQKIIGKLSSGDEYLIPAIANLLIEIEPEFSTQINFTKEILKDFDVVIATGSNNTARYFEYYFSKYPHIIRKNRNAIAVLTGKESSTELHELGDDIFMYFGLGCRNVSKIMVPEGYSFIEFFESIEDFSYIGDHSKYRNNYDYNKSIFLVNGDVHFDNAFLLLKEDTRLASSSSVLHYEYYKDIDQVNNIIEQEAQNIQCVVSIDSSITGSISPGTAQHPKLWDYADGVDTVDFLLKLGDKSA